MEKEYSDRGAVITELLDAGQTVSDTVLCTE